MRMTVDAMGWGHAPKVVVQDLLGRVSDTGMDDVLPAYRRSPVISTFMSAGKGMEKGFKEQDG